MNKKNRKDIDSVVSQINTRTVSMTEIRIKDVYECMDELKLLLNMFEAELQKSKTNDVCNIDPDSRVDTMIDGIRNVIEDINKDAESIYDCSDRLFTCCDTENSGE